MRSFIASIAAKLIVIIFVMTAMPPWFAWANASGVKFEHVFRTGAEIRGNSVLQDRQGFVWIATQNGLARYDGYGLKWYKKTGKPGSISHDQANALYEDDDGMIWIGTFGDGLNMYNPDTDYFIRYGHDPGDPASLVNDQIWALGGSRGGNIWVGTGKGVSYFNKKTKRFVNFLHDPENTNSISGNTIRAVFEDREGDLWIGTYAAGLTRYEPDKNKFTRFMHDPGDENSLSHNDVRSIYQDRAGNLWIATLEGGLNKLKSADPVPGRFTRFMHDPDNPYSIGSNDVRQVLEDRDGMFWVASGLSGVSRFYPPTGRFENFVHDPLNPDSIGFNNVYNILEDRSGILFFFNVSGKIDKYDVKSRRFNLYQHNPYNVNSLSTSSILHIFEDTDGIMWLGGFKEGGLNRFDPKTGSYTRYPSDANDPSRLKYSYPTEFIEDRLENFWVSTSNVSTATLSLFDRAKGLVVKRYEHDENDPKSLPKSLFNFSMINDRDDPDILWIGTYGSGLVKFEKNVERFTRFMKDPDDPATISDNIVYDLYQDNEGYIWAGTQTGGLCRFDPATRTFKRYTHNPDDPNTIGKGFVTEIREDAEGNLWAVSYGSGFNKLDRKTGSFQHFTKDTGFITNQVQAGPLMDEEGKLWMSTDVGIVKFNPETGLVEKRYTQSDGLQGNIFQYFSGFKTQTGELWFGGPNGVNSFFPEKLSDNSFTPPVFLTALTQGGEPIDTGRALDRLTTLNLQWKHNFFEFEFAALNYTQPEKNQYKYMIQGLDQNWFDAGTRRFGRYAKIPGGSYVLRIKASNNNGIWSRPEQEVAINVFVSSPFWKTGWFYLIIVCVFLSLMGFFLFYLVKLKHEIRERRSAEKALLDEKEFTETALNSQPDTFFLFNPETGKAIRWNQAFNDITGYSDEEIAAMTAPAGYYSPEDFERAAAFIRDLGNTGSGTIELDLICKDGQTVPTEYNVSRILESERHPTYFISVGRDISERKQAEEEKGKLETQLRQAQKMESIGTLAGGIAHDFNNILFPILGYADMLKEDFPKESPNYDKLDRIYTSALRAKDLVKQILTFSRQEKYDLQYIRIHPVAKEVLKLIRSTIPTTIEIRQDIHEDCGAVKADPTQIHQIMMNLTTNAYHAMVDTGGELNVGLKEVKLGKLDTMLPDMMQGKYVCLSVSDTGTGMKKSLTEKIFDPFFTTKEKGKGTGMGLSVVHGLVRDMNGAITVYSEPGKGTIFHVYLPVEEQAPEDLKPDREEIVPGGDERILIVDDEEGIIRMESQILERLGYCVTARSDSSRALALFKDDPHAFDLIITDMAMPKLPGDKLAEKLHHLRPDIPILICTGFSDILTEEKALDLGIQGLLLKPIITKDFALKIRELLDGR